MSPQHEQPSKTDDGTDSNSNPAHYTGFKNNRGIENYE